MGKKSFVSTPPFFWTGMIWRFFTGDFVDGKDRNNHTWLREATAPKHQLNWWLRMPRLKRMLIRHALMWPLVAGAVLSIFSVLWGSIYFGLLFTYAVWKGAQLIERHVFMHVNANGSDYRAMRPKYVRQVAKLPDVVGKHLSGGGKDE